MSEQENPSQPQSQPSSAAALFVDLKNSIDALAAVQAPKSVTVKIYADYGAGRKTAQVISLIGWLVVVIGVFSLVYGLSQLGQPRGFGGPSINAMMSIAAGAFLLLTGILQVAVGQMMRASMDSADYARQSLQIQAAMLRGVETIDVSKWSGYNARN